MDEPRSLIDLEAIEAVEGELPLDELFEVLSDELCRYALYYLSDHRTASLERLADAVAGARAATSDTIAAPADRERIQARLYHSVLPRLEHHGLVEFDADERTVTRATRRSEVTTLLDLNG